MGANDKISIDIFKVVNRALSKSDDVDTMVNHLTQLLVGALEIKGATLFALNPETDELELLAGFGLSIGFMNKGPVFANKSIGFNVGKEPVVISDVTKTDRLQYPDDVKREGIAAIISIPVKFSEKVIGALRLYHGETWDVSIRDLDSLDILAENIGMAMMYTRVLNALRSVKDTVNEVHKIWLDPS